MRKYSLPQSAKDMEHIQASQLSDHLDEYLHRCSAENIGFIVDTDKKSYVLCPARWFDYAYDDDFGVIINTLAAPGILEGILQVAETCEARNRTMPLS